MSTIKRLVGSIRTNFEWMVNQVENHEALVTSVIKEAQGSQAKARVQLALVRKDGERMRKRQNELEREISEWTDRAVKNAKIDEKCALECLKRKKRAVDEKENLVKQLDEHRRVEAQLGKDLELVEQKIEELRVKRNTLRTRESRADALRAVHQDETGIMSDLEQILERWEVKVTQAEIHSEVTLYDVDDFSQKFVEEEEESLLKAELAHLVESQT